MRYQDEVTGEVEVLWNSRDGVTPFVITSKAGNPAKHIDWHLDRYAPDYEPAVGDRIFDDKTLDECRAWRREFVDKHRDLVTENYPDDAIEKVIEDLAQADYHQFSSPPPVIREVTQTVLEGLRQRRKGIPTS